MHVLLVTRELSGRQNRALARGERGSMAIVAWWLPRPWRGHKGSMGHAAGQRMLMTWSLVHAGTSAVSSGERTDDSHP